MVLFSKCSVVCLWSSELYSFHGLLNSRLLSPKHDLLGCNNEVTLDAFSCM